MKIIDVRMRPPFLPYLDKNGMFDTRADNPFAVSRFYRNFGMNMSESMKTASMEQLFAEMDRAGEITGVVSIRRNSRGYENDALVDLLKKYPERFLGACGIAPDSSPETIRKSVEESLRKLGTDYIDLYYQHRIDPKVEPEAVAETMGLLIKEGKIRYWGISETTEEYLRRAHAVCPVTAIENRYSMMARWHETIFPVCEELDVAYVAFSPMANGFLTGKYTPATKFEGSQDYRAAMPQYTEEGYEKAKELLNMLTNLAKEKNASMGQLSLAWMINKKPYIVPIPGSRKIERLKENFEAGNVVLTQEEIAMIDSRLDTMEFDVFGGHSAK